jgi:hypothetical protein
MHFGTCDFFGYTVTKATQNEGLLWKVEVLGMAKPPVDAGTFFPSPISGIFHSSILEISSGLWSKTFSVLFHENSVRASNKKCQEKLPEIHRMVR